MKVQSGRIKRIEGFELVLRMEPSPFKPYLDFAKNQQAYQSLVIEAIVPEFFLCAGQYLNVLANLLVLNGLRHYY